MDIKDHSQSSDLLSDKSRPKSGKEEKPKTLAQENYLDSLKMNSEDTSIIHQPQKPALKKVQISNNCSIDQSGESQKSCTSYSKHKSKARDQLENRKKLMQM